MAAFDYAARIRPSWVSAVTPSSRPFSSTILPSFRRNTVVPVKCILRPVAAGSEPARKSLNAGPVCVPPPSQRPTTWSPSAIRSAVPQKLRSGNAWRKSVMNALMSSRPRRGSCNEYCSSMSGAASSSTISRLQVLPQKSVNHRPTIALLACALLSLSCSVLIAFSPLSHRKSPTAVDDLHKGLMRETAAQTPFLASQSISLRGLRGSSRARADGRHDSEHNGSQTSSFCNQFEPNGVSLIVSYVSPRSPQGCRNEQA